MYRLPDEVGQVTPKRLERLFDCLEGTVRRCPEGCRKTLILAALIIHLNDDHKWSREHVATWLAGNGTPKPEDIAV